MKKGSTHTPATRARISKACKGIPRRNRPSTPSLIQLYRSEWSSWNASRHRCFNPKMTYYANYGGAGITMCPQWANSFPTFLADMGPKPAKGYQLERIDKAGHYEPGNCRWALKATVDPKNRRGYALRNTPITLNGQTQTLYDWAEQGIGWGRVARRIKTNGISPVEALDPNYTKLPQYTFQGFTGTTAQLAEKFQQPLGRLRERLKKGWSIEDAMTYPSQTGKYSRRRM